MERSRFEEGGLGRQDRRREGESVLRLSINFAHVNHAPSTPQGEAGEIFARYDHVVRAGLLLWMF
jgi:hypothetical protein